jgi:hypothetical protein
MTVSLPENGLTALCELSGYRLVKLCLVRFASPLMSAFRGLCKQPAKHTCSRLFARSPRLAFSEAFDESVLVLES